jgi:hypothetical protein
VQKCPGAIFDESIRFVSPAAHEDVAGVAFHRKAVLPWAIGRWAAASGKQVLLWTTGQVMRRRTGMLAGKQEHCESQEG